MTIRSDVLVVAYACHPGEGSEKGVGWHWLLQIAMVSSRVVALVRSSSRFAIESAPDKPSNCEFVYIDLPQWVQRLKRRDFLTRIYYTAWQLKAGIVGRRLQHQYKLAFVHHLTWASITSFTGALLIPGRLVVGPVGGATPTQWRLCRGYSADAVLYEIWRTVLRRLWRISPVYRLLMRRADVVLVQNETTQNYVPRSARTILVSNAGIEAKELRSGERTAEKHSAEQIRVAYIGRLVAWKGISIAIEAMAELGTHVARFVVVGDGPERARAERLASYRGLSGVTTFSGWIDRSELFAELDRTDVLILPSQHEEGAPFVIVEAMARGVRPVALNLGGPAHSVGSGGVLVDPSPVRTLPRRLAEAVRVAGAMERSQATTRAERFVWEEKRAILRACYETGTGVEQDRGV
jgi:glycosyltransferase involved in cell wall biosynthesis